MDIRNVALMLSILALLVIGWHNYTLRQLNNYLLGECDVCFKKNILNPSFKQRDFSK